MDAIYLWGAGIPPASVRKHALKVADLQAEFAPLGVRRAGMLALPGHRNCKRLSSLCLVDNKVCDRVLWLLILVLPDQHQPEREQSLMVLRKVGGSQTP